MANSCNKTSVNVGCIKVICFCIEWVKKKHRRNQAILSA